MTTPHPPGTDRRIENTQLFVSFRLADDHFLLPVQAVQEVQRSLAPAAVPLAPSWLAGIINLRGEIIPTVDLGELLTGRAVGVGAMTVVLRSDEGVFSLLAEEVNDVIEAPLSAMAPPPAHLDARLRGLVRHVLRTPDGLLLVLDVPGIVSFLKADGRV